MKKNIFFFWILAASLTVMSQSQPDSTLVDKNFQRLGELKTKIQQVGKAIDDQEEKEVSNYEIMQILRSLDEKVSQMALRQDSLIAAGQKKLDEEKAAKARQLKRDRFYLVIESHLTPDRAVVAMANHDDSFEEALAVRQSSAGKWFYVILADGVSAQELKSSLGVVRRQVPTAWYIAGSKLKE